MMNVQHRISNNELWCGAGDEVRTRDIQLGKLTLYQLSYTRIVVLLQLGPYPKPRDSENYSHSHKSFVGNFRGSPA